MEKHKEITELFESSRLMYINKMIEDEDILISSFGKLKEIIDRMAIPMSKFDIEEFFKYMLFDYVFLSVPLNSKIFKITKYITLDIYPNYQIYAYNFSNIELEHKLETRTDFLHMINNNTLSIQELKIIILHLYYITYAMYMNKNVSIKNELEAVFGRYISIENYDTKKFATEIDSNNKINIDNTFNLFDSKINNNGTNTRRLLIRIKDIS